MKKLFLLSFAVIAIIFFALITSFIPSIGIGLAVVMVAAPKTNNQLAEYAKNAANFSNFGGQEMAYTGFNDDALDFGGSARSFMDKLSSNRIFTMTLTNGLATAEYVTLIPDYTWYPSQTGTRLDGAKNTSNIVVDGAIKTVGQVSLTGAGSPTAILDFLAYIAKRPVQCGLIRISVDSSHTEQLDKQIIVGAQNPFESPGFKPIPIQNSVLPSYFNQKVAIVKTPDLVIGDEIQLSMQILAGATVNVSFYCGAALSNFRTLKNKMSKASNTLAALNSGDLVIAEE